MVQFVKREHLLYVFILNGMHCSDKNETITLIVPSAVRGVIRLNIPTMELMRETNIFQYFNGGRHYAWNLSNMLEILGEISFSCFSHLSS